MGKPPLVAFLVMVSVVVVKTLTKATWGKRVHL